jgi:hypothetical protein
VLVLRLLILPPARPVSRCRPRPRHSGCLNPIFCLHSSRLDMCWRPACAAPSCPFTAPPHPVLGPTLEPPICARSWQCQYHT